LNHDAAESHRSVCLMRRSLTCLFVLSALLLSGCSHYIYRPISKKSYAPPPPPGTLAIPEGTTFRARLNDTLDSGTRTVIGNFEGDRFTATLIQNVYGSGRLAMPSGTKLNGYVADIKRVINRTSMKLAFTSAQLPDGRLVMLNAEPKAGSGLDLSEVAAVGKDAAKDFLIEKGIDAATAGVFAPLWIARKVVKAYGFVTKEERMILPKGAIMTVELKAPAYVPIR